MHQKITEKAHYLLRDICRQWEKKIITDVSLIREGI